MRSALSASALTRTRSLAHDGRATRQEDPDGRSDAASGVDARTHHGTSGAPVVMHDDAGDPQLRWKLLGVHSAGMEMGGRGVAGRASRWA